MSELRFLLNESELASISNRGRNIISAYVSGDLLGPELATAHMTGGYYGEPHETSHRIWLDRFELTGSDEIEIQFAKVTSTSGSGKTIEEHAESHANHEKLEEPCGQDMHSWLANQPERFSFELVTPSCEVIKTRTDDGDFYFQSGVMWKWTNPDEANVRLTSTSLENMKQEKSGKTHSKFKLQLDQGV